MAGDDPVDGGSRPAQRLDLGGVLHRPQRAEHRLGGAERAAWADGPGGRARSAPRCGRRGRPRRDDPASSATSSTGSSVSSHGAQREHVGPLDDPGRLEPGHDERGLAVAGQDQHGQPLQRHGLVAGQPGQVGADRQQERVDPVALHPAPADPARPGSAKPGLTGVCTTKLNEMLMRSVAERLGWTSCWTQAWKTCRSPARASIGRGRVGQRGLLAVDSSQ